MKINFNINQTERAAVQNVIKGQTLCTDKVLTGLLDKVEAACIRSENPSASKDVKTLQTMTWYVAEVSFRSGNPIHRCIAFHRSGGHLELVASYEGIEHAHIDNLAYFRPIQKLTAMDDKCVDFLPKDAPIIIYIKNL